MAACLYTSVLKYLSESEAKKLITLFELHAQKIVDEYPNAVFTDAQELLIQQQATNKAVAEYVDNNTPKEGLTPEDTKLLIQVYTQTAQYYPPIIITQKRVKHALVWFSNITKTGLSKDKIAFVDKTRKALQSLYTSPNPAGIAALTRVWTKVVTGVTTTSPKTTLQLGTNTADKGVTPTLAEELLQNPLTYNTPLGTDNTKEGERVTLSTALEAKSTFGTSLLQTIPNLMTNLFGQGKFIGNAESTTALIADILSGLDEQNIPEYAVLDGIVETQKESLARFQRFHNKMSMTLVGTPQNPGIVDFLYKNTIYKSNLEGEVRATNSIGGNPFGHLVQVSSTGEKSIPENVLTAMNATMYTWLGTQGAQTLYNNQETVNKILGYAPSASLDLAAYTEFAHVGMPQVLLAENLGKSVVKLLGLTTKKENADGDYQAKLELAIGQTMVMSLVQSNLLEQISISAETINKYHSKSVSGLSKSNHTNFTKIVGIPTPARMFLIPHTYITGVIADIPHIKDVFEQLFGLEDMQDAPKFSPPRKETRKIKRDFIMQAPTDLNEAVDALDQVAFKIKSNVSQAYFALPHTLQAELLGYVDDISKQHITEEFGLEGVNRTVLKDIQNAQEFVQTTEAEKEFYFTHSVVNNTRVMIKSDTLNPETSKLHRHLVGTSGSAIQVDSEDTRLYFKAAAIAGFGVDISNMNAIQITRTFRDLVQDPDVKSSINTLRRLLNTGTPYKEGSAKRIALRRIMRVTKTAKDPIHAFDVLVNLVEYSADTPFDTNLSIETDGKTNGVPLAVLQIPSESFAIRKLALSSVYVDTTAQNKAEKKTDDNYKALVRTWVRNMQKQNDKSQAVQYVYGLLGRLVDSKKEVTSTGRKFGKGALMPGALYGASNTRIEDSIANTVLANFYAGLMEAGRSDNPQQAVDVYIEEFNQAVGSDIKITDYSNLREEVLPREEQERFLQLVRVVAGVPMSNALDQQFPAIKATRSILNNAAVFLFHAFDAHLQKELTQRVALNNGMALTKNEIQQVVLELIEVVPAVRTFFSNRGDEARYSEAGQDVHIEEAHDDRMLLLDTKSVRDYSNPNQKIQVGFSLPIRNTATGAKSVTGQISKPTFTDPGISTFPKLIQAIDSAVAASTYKNTPMLNLFDAGLYSLNDVKDGTKAANKAIADISEQYNIVEEMLYSLETVLKTFETSPELAEDYNRALLKDYRIETISTDVMLKQLRDLIKNNNAAKKRLNTKDFIVKNIGFPGAEYVPSLGEQSYTPPTELETETLVKEEIEKVLGSEGEAVIDFSDFEKGNTQTLSADEISTIFEDLEDMGNVNDSPIHTQTLKTALNDLVKKSFVSFDKANLNYSLRIDKSGGMTYGGVQGKKVYINAADRNTAPSSTQGMSVQETYVHELIHTVTAHALANSTFTRGQIVKLFREVKKQITVEHFLPVSIRAQPIDKNSVEYKEAKKRYEYIFENESGNSLEEFIAFGVTNKAFIEILKGASARPNKSMKGNTLWENVNEIWERVLTWLNETIRGMGKNPSADKALLILVKELTQKNHEKKKSIFKHLDLVNRANTASIDAINTHILTPLQNYRKALRDKENKHLGQRALRTLLGLPEMAKTTIHSDIVRQVMKAIKVTEKTIMVALARELIGSTERSGGFNKLLRLSNKTVDQARKQVADSVHKDLLDHYSTTLTKEEKTALTKALLKPDTSILFDVMSVDDIVTLLADPTALIDKIHGLEADLVLAAPTFHTYYKVQADNLGHYLAKGTAIEEGLALNANNIAYMYTGGSPIASVAPTVVKQIDILSTLHALKYTETKYKTTLAEVIRREYTTNPDGTGLEMNGIANTLSTIDGFKKESLQHLFDNNPVLVTKGYTHETYNPNTTLQVGRILDKTKMKDEGYTLVSELVSADIDPTKGLALYKSKVDGTRTRVKTIASITNKVARGTSLMEAALAADPKASKLNKIISLHKAKEVLTNSAQKQQKGLRAKANKTFMVPTLNSTGVVTDLRYTMSEEIKDTELEKLNDFAAILGSARGSVVDKTNSKLINRELLQLLKEDYDEYGAKRPGSFVRISKDAQDPELKEIYALMPKDMIQDMRRIWGKDEIYIKEEFVKLVFGFRKLTITNAPGMRTVLNTPVAKKLGARTKLLYTEKLWTDFVGIAKDMIVIKSITVLEDNVISNTVLLWIRGVPILDILVNQTKALVAMNAYQKLISKRSRLERKLVEAPNLSPQDVKTISSKIANLTHSIDVNPVKNLVDEGLFQAILEDLDVGESVYTFKSKLEEVITPTVEKYVPTQVTWATKQALMTHDTFVYQTLFKATQYSDFIARYTLYEHLVNNKNVSHETALVDVIDTFINYDVPTSPELQWLNDMGFIMFTKFALRIQKIILKSFIKHPVNAVSVEAFGISPTISDSFLTPTSFLGKFQNPIIAIPDTAINLGGLDMVTGGAI